MGDVVGGDEYDSEADYDEGVLFIKDNVLCKTTGALTGGEHDESLIEKTTIAAEISSLNGKTSAAFITETVSKSVTLSANGQSAVAMSFDTPEGYTPIGITAFNTGHGSTFPMRFVLSDDLTYVNAYLRTIESSSVTATPSATILFAKSDLL